VQLPEIVFRFYENQTPDDYLVSHKSAQCYRHAYRKALFKKTIAEHEHFYRAHCWRHTEATEILVEAQQNGLTMEEGRMQARWSLGHIKSKVMKEMSNFIMKPTPRKCKSQTNVI